MLYILYIHSSYKHVMSLGRLPPTHPLAETDKPVSVPDLVELDTIKICRTGEMYVSLPPPFNCVILAAWLSDVFQP